MRPRVSIVIPVHNEGASVRSTLEAVLADAPARLEIIVVDDDSTDGGCDFLRGGGDRFAGVRLLRQERGGVAGARNRGAAHAEGEFLVFLDAHCHPEPGWLDLLLDAASSCGDGIYGPCLADAGDPACKGYGATLTDWDLQYRWLPRHDDRPYEAPLVGGGCMVVRRDYFDELGRFDAMRIFGCEDVEICLRCWLAGGAVRVVPGSEVRHAFKPRLNYMTFGEDRVYNALRTIVLHLDGAHRERALDHLRKRTAYFRAVDLLLRSDVWERHGWVRSRRQRDPGWYWERFQVPL